jgi:serine phosphatase RsbU (regulator of sigma subunit)
MATTELAPGELLAVFSDGLPEATRGGEFFDDERVRQALLEECGEADLEELSRRVIRRVLDFVGDDPRADDMTLVLVRRV